MKSYHEVAHNVFRRRDEDARKRHCKELIFRRVSTAMLAAIFAAALLYSAGIGYVYAVHEGIVGDFLGFLRATDIEYEVTDDGEIIAREMPDWGITLTAANVTPTGMTLICTQSGNDIHGEIMTGPQFYLEVKTNSGWVCLRAEDGSNVWHLSTYAIPKNDSVSWTMNWSNMYGELAPGTYRLSKPFWEGQLTQDSQFYNYKAEFTIEAPNSDSFASNNEICDNSP